MDTYTCHDLVAMGIVQHWLHDHYWDGYWECNREEHQGELSPVTAPSGRKYQLCPTFLENFGASSEQLSAWDRDFDELQGHITTVPGWEVSESCTYEMPDTCGCGEQTWYRGVTLPDRLVTIQALPDGFPHVCFFNGAGDPERGFAICSDCLKLAQGQGRVVGFYGLGPGDCF